MRKTFRRRHAVTLLGLPLLAFASACATQAQPQVASGTSAAQSGAGTATAATGTTASQTAPTAATGAAPVVFRIVQGQSTATFKVREQLAGRELPNDAVGTTSAVSGQLTLTPEGAIVAEGSRITVQLASLTSDSTMRDGYIRRNTLQTDRYPTAEFVPTAAQGLPSPLPASGEYSFRLTGPLTLHGVQKEVTWDVTARREGTGFAGTATTAFSFGDFGMTRPSVAAVLSIVDEIRLETSLVANQTA